MSGFVYETEEEFKGAYDRALRLKPKFGDLIATEDGWCDQRQDGTLELLVSFKNLGSLLHRYELATPAVVTEAPVVEEVAPVVEQPVVEDVVESTEETPAAEVVEETAAPEAPKRGRKKVVTE